MAERPILFQGAMVRALIADTKTQTRRALRIQPPQHTVAVGRWQDPPGYDAAWWAFVREGPVERDHPFGGAVLHGEPWRCPYGQPGDRLWVRESWMPDPPNDGSWAYTAWAGERILTADRAAACEVRTTGVALPATGWKADKLGSSLAWPADTSMDAAGVKGPDRG